MAQSSLATKSHSFDLVKGEIEHTIMQTEQSLERFQENRHSGEDLQNCLDFLNQLRGIFVLVELRGGILLCQEAVAITNEVPVGASDDKNALLAALSNGLFILRRYIEYYQQQRNDQPELLLPIINELREARKEKPYPDSCFFDLDCKRRPDFCAGLGLTPLGDGSNSDFELHSRRMRLMYQVGLLDVLRDKNPITGLKLLARSARGLTRLCNGAPMGQIYALLTIVLETLLEQRLPVERPRKKLFMRFEKYAREMVYVGPVAISKEAPESLYKELIYILWRSGSDKDNLLRILQAFGLSPSDLPESRMLVHRKRLYGPGTDVLKSLSVALQEEINLLKDKLDIVERGIEPDVTELGHIAAGLDRLANTLLMLDLSKLCEVAKHQAEQLRAWEAAAHVPKEKELYAIADAVLSIEEAALQIVTTGITPETDAIAARSRHDEGGVYLREATYVVCEEARAALTLAKRAITAFLESDHDKMHLANLPDTLRSIWGGLMMLGDPEAAEVLARIAAGIDRRLLKASGAPEHNILEALADALTSLEYYIESMNTQEARNSDLLKLAASAMTDVSL